MRLSPISYAAHLYTLHALYRSRLQSLGYHHPKSHNDVGALSFEVWWHRIQIHATWQAPMCDRTNSVLRCFIDGIEFCHHIGKTVYDTREKLGDTLSNVGLLCRWNLTKRFYHVRAQIIDEITYITQLIAVPSGNHEIARGFLASLQNFLDRKRTLNRTNLMKICP